MKLGFLFEHPEWSADLIAEFHRQGVDIEPVNVAELAFDTSRAKPEWAGAINRINIMPSADRKPSVAFHVQHYLGWLENSGIRVINGSRCHAIGASKAQQNGIFAGLGLDHPRAIAVYRPEEVLEAADQIGYPVIFKPNIGGSGSGVSLHRTRESLDEAVRFKTLDFGVDRTAVLQEYVESDGFVYRVEMLGDELFYSIRQPIQEGSFNYCAADGCSTIEDNGQGDDAFETEDDFDFCVIGGESRIEKFKPEDEVVESVAAVITASGGDLGGVEFFMDVRSGKPKYYDFNPYSNFVSNGQALLGFSPEARYVEFVTGLFETG